jgi:transposase
MSDLADAHAKGYLSQLPHYNSVFNYLEAPALTPILRDLISESSRPLAAVETDFAVDGTGFGTSATVTWYSKQYGHDADNADWLELHLITGVTTNVVTGVEVSGRDAHDDPSLPPLVATTARHFRMHEVSADKGYSGVSNLEAIVAAGATPFVPFKANTTGDGGGSALWRKMWGYYRFQRDEFLEHYHKRSNVESTNSTIKAKFGGRLRSKGETGQVNEAPCKVLAHNICVLIQPVHELGIAPTFRLAS